MHDIAHVLNPIAERLVGREIGDDGDFALALEPVNLIWPAGFTEIDKVRQLNETGVRAAGVFQRDIFERLLRCAIAGLGTQPDIVEVIVLAEGTDDLAAD